MIRRGRVLEVLPSGRVWVTVPSLTGEVPVGPVPCAVMPAVPAVGDEVLVAHVDGGRTDLVVLAVVTP